MTTQKEFIDQYAVPVLGPTYYEDADLGFYRWKSNIVDIVISTVLPNEWTISIYTEENEDDIMNITDNELKLFLTFGAAVRDVKNEYERIYKQYFGE